MSRVKIETLTPIHIGSGDVLRYGSDFIVKNNQVGIVDYRKVMSLIGGPEKINDWVEAIEKKVPIDVFVSQYNLNSELKDYSYRVLPFRGKVKNTDSLKVFIHDGLGCPYMPGSSIKGAIRTAVLEHIMRSQGDDIPIRNHKNRLDAMVVENRFFGRNPYTDIFRILRVEDAYFEKGCESVVRLVNINERQQKDYWDESKSQLVEVLEAEKYSSEFEITLNQKLFDSMGKNFSFLPDGMQSIFRLFHIINEYTGYLLDSELNYWEKHKGKNLSGKVKQYLSRIMNIKEKVEECEEGKECIIRIGHGSGWNFITGGWIKQRSDFKDIVLEAIRKNKFYMKYDFPKTRRVSTDCVLLGFVKMSLLQKL